MEKKNRLEGIISTKKGKTLRMSAISHPKSTNSMRIYTSWMAYRINEFLI